MPLHASVAEAKAQFSRCLKQAEGGQPVVITRHGKAVAALVSTEILGQLRRLQAAGPAAGLAGLAHRWDDGGAFADDLVKLAEERGSPREVPELGE